MSKNISKIKKIPGGGFTPTKPLNPFVKAVLLNILKRNDIVIKTFKSAGDDTYMVTNSEGDELFSFDNAWDCGYCNISVEDLIVAEVDGFDNTNYAHEHMFDILKAIQAKQNELRLVKEKRKHQRISIQERQR